MPDPHLHPTDPHPPEWQRDLNPNFRAGQNSTMGNAAAGKDWATAFDVKDIHRALGKAFRDDELKAIPIVPTGSRLTQGKTYIDLVSWPGVEFTANADLVAGQGNHFVPKDEVDYRLWNRLIGVDDPARLDESA